LDVNQYFLKNLLQTLHSFGSLLWLYHQFELEIVGEMNAKISFPTVDPR